MNSKPSGSDPALNPARSFDLTAAEKALPARPIHIHKKQAVVLLVAGCAQYLGAALLCARGTYRSGAGLVRLALPTPLANTAMAAFPEIVVHGMGYGASLTLEQANAIEALALGAHAVVVGPGLGRDWGTQALVQWLWEHLSQPAVFDADALVHLDFSKTPGGPRVLTPHEGELIKLLGADALAKGRPAAARKLAAASRSIALLKGNATLVASPDGTLSVNTTGTAVLATAGTGDVLSGAIAALIAQGAGTYDAACLGAWAHGWAGEKWAKEHAGRGLLASDLADLLPTALAQAGA